jgi:hypothetical protein
MSLGASCQREISMAFGQGSNIGNRSNKVGRMYLEMWLRLASWKHLDYFPI